MTDLIQIPFKEYQQLQEEIALLKDVDLLKKLNRLIELLYRDRYGLVMTDQTDDLTEYAVNNLWKNEDTDAWDNL